MLGKATADWQSKRRESARQEILSAAWEVARDSGLAALTLREVAARVGMRAPSLYTHFASKHAIYDAMFGQAWLAYETETDAVALPTQPRAVLRVLALLGGLADSQWANDPGGTRYARLLDRAVDMYADALQLPQVANDQGADQEEP